jgi:hypothetical protein
MTAGGCISGYSITLPSHIALPQLNHHKIEQQFVGFRLHCYSVHLTYLDTQIKIALLNAFFNLQLVPGRVGHRDNLRHDLDFHTPTRLMSENIAIGDRRSNTTF